MLLYCSLVYVVSIQYHYEEFKEAHTEGNKIHSFLYDSGTKQIWRKAQFLARSRIRWKTFEWHQPTLPAYKCTIEQITEPYFLKNRRQALKWCKYKCGSSAATGEYYNCRVWLLFSLLTDDTIALMLYSPLFHFGDHNREYGSVSPLSIMLYLLIFRNMADDFLIQFIL